MALLIYSFDLPQSLLEAIRYFVLINGVTDYRLDNTEHRSMLKSDEQREIFSCKLARVGFQDKDREKYKDYRFRLNNCSVYTVIEGFPRLTKNTVPAEITDARYELNLAAIASFSTQEI